MKSTTKRKYSVVDLFAGAGGLSYGFLQTGRFEVKAAFEMNQNAQQTYKRNHGDSVLMYKDVQEALSEEIIKTLGEIDVVIGGPPCQGFSSANRQKNHAISQNNSLVKKYVQAVQNIKPSAFIMENVSMLQSNIHRFYVDKNDRDAIDEYSIATTSAEIQLLDEEYLFDGVCDIVNSREKITNYLWDEKEYHALNVIYKSRNKGEKAVKALERHRKRLTVLSEKLTMQRKANDHVINNGNLVGDAINQYYANAGAQDAAIALGNTIETVIMLQRMLFKAMEINDNKILVEGFSVEHGLTACVTSMAVVDYIESILESDGYKITKGVLSAASFGAPQKRMRFVIMGVKKNTDQNITLPVGAFTEDCYRTVEDAIKDIECVRVDTSVDEENSGVALPALEGTISELGLQLRNSKILYNHVSTNTTPGALARFKVLKQGDNFHNLPTELKSTYSDEKRTQNTIYLRLKYNEPSGTVVNVRKSMWIHPSKSRALSIREAARLQTFPDSFVFCGTKDSQYQQVGNAVPPMLANALANNLCKYLD